MIRTSDFKTKIFRFRVILNRIVPAIWRIIDVPANYTFRKFHFCLIGAMGWSGYHLFFFHGKNLVIGPETERPMTPPYFPSRIRDYWSDKNKRLYDYFLNETIITYEYDMGDSWEHTIILEDILPKEKKKYPICIDGRRACPPEDCGGVPGYYHILEVLADSSHEEHEDIINWLSKNYDPEKFDLQETNENIKYTLKHPEDFEEIFGE